MTRSYSVLIPHLSTPECDRALHLCLETLRENSEVRDHEVIVVQGFTDPYAFWNRYADVAAHEVLVFLNNDMVPAPGWDRLMLRHIDDNSLVMGYLVEPGVLPPAKQNVHKDFGRRPASFRRKEFEDFCAAVDAPECTAEMGWYMPVMLTKSFFKSMGRYPNARPFPHPNDVAFFAACRDRGAQLKRVRSFAYHFQNLSNPTHDRNR